MRCSRIHVELIHINLIFASSPDLILNQLKKDIIITNNEITLICSSKIDVQFVVLLGHSLF